MIVLNRAAFYELVRSCCDVGVELHEEFSLAENGVDSLGLAQLLMTFDDVGVSFTDAQIDRSSVAGLYDLALAAAAAGAVR